MINVKGKYIFLSGPMSDDPETYHAHDFIDAHIKLKEMGAFFVYDPAIEWLTRDVDECDQPHDYWMRRCIAELVKADFSDWRKSRYDLLISLSGWQKSEGASTEREVAKACGIQCVNISEVVDEV